MPSLVTGLIIIATRKGPVNHFLMLTDAPLHIPYSLAITYSHALPKSVNMKLAAFALLMKQATYHED
ncbi:MAG: hypothetical protein PF961_19825 [Planctomycetota bacterium]|jgi:hypothetical protein|nr:hypothetical protein [Planctomycetota bacterium]